MMIIIYEKEDLDGYVCGNYRWATNWRLSTITRDRRIIAGRTTVGTIIGIIINIYIAGGAGGCNG